MSETLILNKKINLYAQMCHVFLFIYFGMIIWCKWHEGYIFLVPFSIFEQFTSVLLLQNFRGHKICHHCENSLTALLFSSNLAPSLPVSRWFMMFLVLRLLLVRPPAAAISANTYCWFWFCKIQQAFVKLWAPLESIREWNWGKFRAKIITLDSIQSL